jgi:endonuclease/exonuclease/phosphatase family metal-dependent hydrolase
MSLRVATLNVWNRLGPWEERRALIRKGIADLSPDIMGLQEVIRMDGEHTFDQLMEIADGLGYHVAYGRSPEAPIWGNGNAILSRWPIEEAVALPLAGTDEARVIVFARIASPHGEIPFYCTHLNWMLHEGHVRQRQVRALADFVADTAPISGFPPIVVGDFNAEPDSDEIRFMRGLTALGGKCVYFADCFGIAGEGPGYTYARRNAYAAQLREPNRRIDYIFVRGPDQRGRGEPLSARLCFDEPTRDVWPSDHFGVVATISV